MMSFRPHIFSVRHSQFFFSRQTFEAEAACTRGGEARTVPVGCTAFSDPDLDPSRPTISSCAFQPHFPPIRKTHAVRHVFQYFEISLSLLSVLEPVRPPATRFRGLALTPHNPRSPALHPSQTRNQFVEDCDFDTKLYPSSRALAASLHYHISRLRGAKIIFRVRSYENVFPGTFYHKSMWYLEAPAWSRASPRPISRWSHARAVSLMTRRVSNML